MKHTFSREYVEAVLVLRSTAEFQRVVAELRAMRDTRLLASMEAPSEHADRLRYGAGAVHELLTSIEDIEQLRREYDNG